jgi:hypothetical protein
MAVQRNFVKERQTSLRNAYIATKRMAVQRITRINEWPYNETSLRNAYTATKRMAVQLILLLSELIETLCQF